MSRNEQVVLLHHPCHYEEMRKKYENPMRPFDTEFEEWTFMDDPKYMMDPMKELLTEIHERMRVSRLLGKTKLLQLVDEFDEDARAVAPPRKIQTIELPDDLTKQIESVWSNE